MATEYESILCVKNEVFVYKIPPRPSNRGYRAADWKLDQHDWKGRLRVVAKGNDCIIKLEDKTSGELFAKCPVDAYPGIAVEAVMDSSRYFVIRLMDENGRTAFIGIGFADRGDSFDFNVALQDHFKWVKQSKKFEEEEKKAAVDPGPKLDLSLKEGQTIKINIGSKKSSTGVARPKPTGQVGFLPPPPGSKIPTLTPPPGQAGQTQPQQPAQQASHNFFGGTTPQSTQQSNQDLLVDFGSSSLSSSSSSSVTAPSSQQKSDWDIFGDFTAAAPPQPQEQPSSTGGTSDWGDFTSAGNQDSKNSGWVQF